ncbi:MAG: hypothetical protein V5B34_14590 [Accumulibacter sp.]|jgi:hypothetical protein
MAVADLAAIAVALLEPLTGSNAPEAARHYGDFGWEVDTAARSAMAIAQPHELERPIYAVLLALYRRWLERQAAGFQALVKRDGYPGWSLPEVADGTVLLFVDGLRLDLARELEAALDKGNGLTVVLQPGFTSVPSVTRSGKVWVSPARKLADGGNGGDFAPRLPKGAYTADKLRKAMELEGVAVVDTESRSLACGKGWAEFPGDIDGDGHAKGRKLACHSGPPRRPGQCHPAPAQCWLEAGLGGDRPRLVAAAGRPAQGRAPRQADRDQVGPLRGAQGCGGRRRLAGSG